MANITTVYNSGLDALANLFEVSINLDGDVGNFFPDSVQEELSFRIQDFSIPASDVNTYSVEWGPWTFDRPNGKVNQTREISFNVRLNRDYSIYQGFVNWKNAIQNEFTGVVSNVKDFTTDITVIPATTVMGDGEDYVLGTVGRGVQFENCFPTSIGDISYDQSSGDPLTLSVQFNFLRMHKDMYEPSGSAGDQGGSSADEVQ